MKNKEDLIKDLENRIFNSSSIIKLESYAGTGKTTTLEEIFKFYPDKRILYLVFNASMKKEAERRLGSQKNVTVRTLHGLAFPFFKNKYPDAEIQNDLTAMDIKEQFKIEDIKLACRIINEYKDFLASEHNLQQLQKDKVINDKIEEDELDQFEELKKENPELVYKINYSKNSKVKYRFANYILQILKLQESGDLGFTHDTYLKLYQLSKPNLASKFNIISIDEAQDITMSTVSLFLDQPCMKILVGDRYQNIYGFRRTTNALEIIKTPHTYELSKSYRIGQEIASLSSEILSKRYERDVNITGVNVSKLTSHLDIPKESIKYMVSRKTISLLNVAQSLHNEGISFNFIGGINTYGVKNALNLLKYGSVYYKGKKLTKSEIYEIFTETEDAELGILISIERSFESPEDLENLIQAEVSEKEAQVILTTAHRSKGLEWDIVHVLDDFNLIETKIDRDTKKLTLEVADYQEYNLFYVAITRAKKDLILDYGLRQQVELIKKYLGKDNMYE